MSRSQATTNPQPMASKAASSSKARINVIYYSMYGHVATCKFIFKINRKILNHIFIS
jgi:hypothetical protein